jgi:CRISPR/Cas system CSM-associated protein Csm3 (group 7 of RAMP superfamily)
MHKRLVNHCTIILTISPNGPILIKSGKEGANPAKPDMEFVETYHRGGKSIYLPGSSLKGAIRAHAERIVRTVGSDRKNGSLWANDPLNDRYDYLKQNNKPLPAPEIYKESSFTDKLFGNTSLASRFRVEDAYPVGTVQLEERNGVAIDRVFGSVAVGPFNYQVCTGGDFQTKIHLKNFTLAQLGLIGLVLRDLNEGWFGLGFAKSRGMGNVTAKLEKAIVQYPGCRIEDAKIQQIGSANHWELNTLLGAGEFLIPSENPYHFPAGDRQSIDDIQTTSMDLGFGVQLIFEGAEQVKELFVKSVTQWASEVSQVNR